MRKAFMRQAMMADLPETHEVGWPICQAEDGSLLLGPMAEGGPMGVDIPLSCPAGTVIIGTEHTHPDVGPGTGRLEPSAQDLEMHRKHGLKHLCISQPHTGHTRCW